MHPVISSALAQDKWREVLNILCQPPANAQYVRADDLEPQQYVPGATRMATVAEFSPTTPTRDALWTQSSQTYDTRIYHRRGSQQVRYRPSRTPEGMTVASLMKLIVFNSTTRFDPFLLVLDQIFPRILNAHERQSVTTWIIIEYRAFSTSNDPLDVERCENINTLIPIANTLVDVMEAINAHDDIAAMARAVHSYLPVVALIAKIESKRYTANHRTTVVEDALALANPPAPPSIHALALMLEKQKRIETAIMGGGATATLALPGGAGQFFRNGGSGSLPAPQDLSSLPSSAQPFTSTPAVFVPLPQANPGAPTTAGSTQGQQKPSRSTPQSDNQTQQPQQSSTVTHVFDLRLNGAPLRNPYNSNRPDHGSSDESGRDRNRNRQGNRHKEDNYQRNNGQFSGDFRRRHRGKGRGGNKY